MLQRKLQDAPGRPQALNLGMPQHDPYDSYWRANYFAETIPPSRVVLVVESSYSSWLARHRRPLRFDDSRRRALRVRSKPMAAALFLLNHSSFAHLAFQMLKPGKRSEAGEERASASGRGPGGPGPSFGSAARQYRQKYGDRFSLVSIAQRSGVERKPAGILHGLPDSFPFVPCFVP